MKDTKDSTYIFVRDHNDFSSVKKLINNKSFNKEAVAVLCDDSFADFLKEAGIQYVLLKEFSKEINFSSLRSNVIALIKSFPHKKILDNKSFVELLDYETYSLWWFIRQGFYGHCLRIAKEVEALKLLIKERKVMNIIILNQDKEFFEIVKEAIKGLNVKIKIINQKSPFYEWRFLVKKILKDKKEMLSEYFPRFVRIIQGFFRGLQIKNKKDKKNILLFTQSHLWTNLGNVKGDANSYTIQRELSKSKYNLIPLDVAISKEAAWKGIKEKKKPFIPYDFFLFKSFLDFGIRKKIKSQKLKLKRLWQELEKNRSLENELICNNISLYQILKYRLKSYFLDDFDSFASAVRNIETAKKMIKSLGIKAVICIDENGSSRFLVFASKMSDIPSIGLQHGRLAEVGISYNYSKEDVYGYKGNLNCQLADKTAVFGKYCKNFLIDIGNYEPKKIVITGQPRTDIFFENKKNYSKRDLCKKLGINPNKKLVVFATERFQDSSDAGFALTAIIKALKNNPKTELIVKVHPSEEEYYYKKILEEQDYRAIVSRDIDLYNIIFCCDLLISISSTVMFEALIADKPVLQLNLLERYDLFDDKSYEKNKIISLVTNQNQLSKSMNSLLFDNSMLRAIKKDRKNFIFDYYNRIDGKSTKRFIKILSHVFY